VLDQYLNSKSSVAGMEPYRVLREVCAGEHADDAAAAEAAFREELARRQQNDPENVPLGYSLAGELLALNRLDEALPLYSGLLKRQAASDAYVALAKIYRVRDNVEGLLEIMQQVVARTESLEVLREEIAQVVERDALVKRLFEHARDKCRDAPQPTRRATALAAAYLAIEAKTWDEFDAFVDIVTSAAGPEKVQVLEQLGLAVFIAEDAKRASRLFQQALAENPDEKIAGALQHYLAGALQFAGDTPASLAAAAQAAELRSDSPRFASRAAWILYQAKQHEQAEQEYLRLIEKYDASHDLPGAREVLREARLALSNIAVERKQVARAEEWLEQVLDEFPEDIGAKNDLGYLWADQGQHLLRALEMIREAVAAEPENVAYRDSLGWAYFRLGRFDDAVRELTAATAADDVDGVILDHLGDAHWSNQQPRLAVAAWRKALAAFRQADQMERLPAIEAKLKQHGQD